MNKTVALLACVVCLGIGYFAGREHLKVEIRQEIQAAIKPFEKAAEASAQSGTCINNLRQLDGAKEQWALEHRKSAGDYVEAADIRSYLVRETIPTCPSGGHYSLGLIGKPPECSAAGHALPRF